VCLNFVILSLTLNLHNFLYKFDFIVGGVAAKIPAQMCLNIQRQEKRSNRYFRVLRLLLDYFGQCESLKNEICTLLCTVVVPYVPDCFYRHGFEVKGIIFRIRSWQCGRQSSNTVRECCQPQGKYELLFRMEASP
jgi:hypothetical protein